MVVVPFCFVVVVALVFERCLFLVIVVVLDALKNSSGQLFNLCMPQFINAGISIILMGLDHEWNFKSIQVLISQFRGQHCRVNRTVIKTFAMS